jgi:hypothetical protein
VTLTITDTSGNTATSSVVVKIGATEQDASLLFQKNVCLEKKSKIQ